MRQVSAACAASAVVVCNLFTRILCSQQSVVSWSQARDACWRIALILTKIFVGTHSWYCDVFVEQIMSSCVEMTSSCTNAKTSMHHF